MKKSKCLLCGSLAELRATNYLGYQEPETFNIYHCPSCNTSFSLPKIDTSTIYGLIYQTGSKVPGYDRYWRYKNAIKISPKPLTYLYEAEETYWGVITVLNNNIKDRQNTKILEIGCGMGYLTYSLVQAGYNAVGLDISKAAVDEAINNFGDHYICADACEYAKQHLSSYDVIIMTEVIEHLDDPLNFLQTAIQMLSTAHEKGLLILTTPNKTIFTDNVIWNTDLPPVHSWWFSENSIKYIANKINCEVSFVNFSGWYKKKPSLVDIAKQQTALPVFSKTGDLNIVRNGFLLHIIKNNICWLIPLWLLKIYRKIKFLLNNNLYFCGEKGAFICAVLKNNIQV